MLFRCRGISWEEKENDVGLVVFVMDGLVLFVLDDVIYVVLFWFE